jgi:serine/threonine protein kinase/phage tail protein X
LVISLPLDEAMMPDHDRNLLFGLLALQNGLITEDDLLKAFRGWTRDKSRSIEQFLRDQKAITETQCERLEGLLREHLERHGSAEKSLAALTPVAPAIASLRQVDDSALNVSLGHVGKARVDPFATRPPTPDEFGSTPASRFRRLRPHAKGGLGEVSVAHDTELNREVALKEIQDHHADRPESRSRFLVEAEITGGLEHPGIVPVYSLGADATGRPYYAMRFIEGETLSRSIARFHDRSTKATPGDRILAFQKLLRRFLDVCNAVHYAHSRSVLHRDLKPDNIMVGDFGETLVVDWGLAKAAGKSDTTLTDGSRPLIPSSGSGSVETIQGHAIGTPAFMSPEQAVGALDQLGPTTDVYSLGATLYALLTGKPPFAITDDERGLNDVGPILSRVSRGEFPHPRAVDPSIARPLEAICLKAMSLAPADRYPTPRALAEDLEHYLADEPVSAHPETFAAKLARWTRRHKSATLSAAAALIVIAAVSTLAFFVVRKALTAEQTALADRTTALSAEQTALVAQKKATAAAEHDRARAEARETMAVDAIKKFEKAVIDNSQLKDDPRLKPLRDTLLREPLQFSKNLRELLMADGDTRPQSLRRLAEVCFSLGRTTAAIGNQEDAATAFAESLTIFERLARENPSVTKYQNDLATHHNNIGNLQSATGRSDLALKSYGRALEIGERLARENPSVAAYQSGLATSHGNLGLLQGATGRADLALKSYGRALEIRERLARENPSVTQHQSGLATTHTNLGNLEMETGHAGLALKSYSLAVEILERLARENPLVTEYQSTLAKSQFNIGLLQSGIDQKGVALKSYGHAMEIFERLARDNPSVADYQSALAKCHHEIGHARSDIGQNVEALKSLGRALTIREHLARENPTVTQYRSDLAASYHNLGLAQSEIGQNDAALKAYGRAVEIRERLACENPASIEIRSGLAKCYYLTACGLALKSATPDHIIIAKSCADEAMNALRRADAAGWTNWKIASEDDDLKALRDRPDFQALLKAKLGPKEGGAK